MKRVLVLAAILTGVGITAWGAITLYDETLTVGRMWETPAVRPHEEPLLPMASGPVPMGEAEALLRLADADTLASPFGETPDASVVAAGRKLYGTYCIFCHGRQYDGQGTVGQSFAPLPGDFRSKRVQSLSAGAIFKEISYGVPGGRQPALATTIPIADRWRLVAFVQSLGPR